MPTFRSMTAGCGSRGTGFSFGNRISRASPLLGLALVLLAQSSLAQELDEDLIGGFGDEEFVTIATGTRQQVSRAPSSATVITPADIKAIGATSLSEALETVPGLHVSADPGGYNPIYIIRGIHTQDNAQVLMLINGVPATRLEAGNRGKAWGRMPVENIQRIEVIRGPGSALYGADAFAGVINVVTKSPDDIDGTEIGARVGSYRSGEAWLLHSAEVAGFKAGFYLDYFQTDGQDGRIDADAQTGADRFFGTRASLAPGDVNLDLDSVHGRLELQRDLWKLRLGYKGGTGGTGAGVGQSLDPFGSARVDEYTGDLSYENPEFAEDWEVSGRLSYANYVTDSKVWVAPPGVDYTPFGGAFPTGVVGKPGTSERNARLDLSAFYTGIKAHRLRFGGGYIYQDLYDVKDHRNFVQTPPLGLPAPVTDHSDSAPFLKEGDRRDLYGFVQDQWNFAPDWELTAGLRYDGYSDFGDTVNPRLALVWQTTYNLTSKLLYGRAFRPPSFSELNLINNPVSLGNPDLDPETIDWAELDFDYQPRGDLRTGLSLFYYDWQDLIRFVPDPLQQGIEVAANSGSQTGYGAELSFQWDLARDISLRGNFAFQNAENEDGDDPGLAPRYLAYLRADWWITPDWLLNGKLNGVFDRKRAPDDPRSKEIDDYVTVDLTLRRDPGKSGLGLAFSVRNLFDADAREPSPAPGFIPDDLPLAGRNFYAELRYRF